LGGFGHCFIAIAIAIACSAPCGACSAPCGASSAREQRVVFASRLLLLLLLLL
jgi:hypothetical protein